MTDELQNDPDLLVRTFTAELTPGEGRTADVRIVPYDKPATVRDSWAPDKPYQESWSPGVFDHQVNAAHRIVANVEHERGIAGIIGKGIALRSGSDALYGSFKFLDTPNGNTALELVRDGTFDGVSLEAYPKRSVRADGIIKRVKADLRAIAFCRTPAFSDARVMAMRESAVEGDTIIDEQYLLPQPDYAALARARELGIKLPAGLAEEVEVYLARAFSDDPWDGSSSNYKDAAAYCEACIIDDNPGGKPKVVELCHLPVKEPDGDYNLNAIRDALARVDQVKTSDANKAEAKTRLEALLARGNKATPNKDADDKN